MRIVLAVLFAAVLSGCAENRALVAPPDKPRLTDVSATLAKDCAWPLTAKEGALDQAGTEALLRTNARAQIACYWKHHDTVTYYAKRDAALRGGQNGSPRR